MRVDTSQTVAGGVKPLALQAECGFRAYGEMRLAAAVLETPAPGLDARERGMLLHKALELVWSKLDHFTLTVTETQVLRPTIADSVAAAVVAVFRGYVPVELRPAVDRETLRLERLIANLLDRERTRASFTVEDARGAPRGQYRGRAVRIPHRPYRCHRRRRLRHPRLQVRRAARAALEWRSGARSTVAGLPHGGTRAQRAGAGQCVARQRPREIHRQELAQGAAAGRQWIAGHEP